VSEPVLQVEGLTKAFSSGGGRLEVLRGVDMAVGIGESVSIRGESGSGKSTLLNLLAGLDEPDAGRILWEGRPARGERFRGAFLGMVFQSFYLIPELDALDNVLMAARILGRTGKAERDRARELLAKVGLAARATHLPSQLSGGERQRVAVARALMNGPRLDLLLGLCRDTRTSLVLVTHNPLHAGRTDRSLTLHLGCFGRA
jgi:predicted ABC-type transport system involved in lysophospholipase L1 biosynthesis ATPase subunit